jgi:hypothetical protein
MTGFERNVGPNLWTPTQRPMDDKRQTRVSRTAPCHFNSDGRGALMFGRCFMFQMFQERVRLRRRWTNDNPRECAGSRK